MSLCGHILSDILINPCNVAASLPFVSVVSSPESLRQLLNHIAGHPEASRQCLLVPQRVLSRQSTHKLLAAFTKLKEYPAAHPLSVAMTQLTGKKPSATLVYHIIPTGKDVARCHTIGESIIPPQKMVFPVKINGLQFKALFDSGATHCFMSSDDACNMMGLKRTPSSINAVATADASLARVLGCSKITCRWGRPGHLNSISTEISEVHILEHLCPGIDLILGDSFLSREHVVMDYASGRCSLGVIKRTSLSPGVAPVEPSPLPSSHEASPSSPHPQLASLTSLEATRYMREGGAAYLIMVRPSSHASCNTASAQVASESSHAGTLPSLPNLTHLPPDQRTALMNLLNKYAALFPATLPAGLPPTQAPCEAVPLLPGANVKPPFKRSFRLCHLARSKRLNRRSRPCSIMASFARPNLPSALLCW